jgi:hypothetical protein
MGVDRSGDRAAEPVRYASARVGRGPAVYLTVLVSVYFATVATRANAQAAVSQRASSTTDDDLEDIGNDMLLPRNTFQSYYQYSTATGSKDDTVTTQTANLRGVLQVPFAPTSVLGLRADVPINGRNLVSDGGDIWGVGDVDAQLAFAHELNPDLRIGAGARLVAPTGGDELGSGKWQILPGAAVRYAFTVSGFRGYFEPEVLYDVSFVGNPAKRDIGNLQFSPTLNIELNSNWFATLYPSQDIRINFSAPVPGQTGPLFLPFDASLGRRLGPGANLALEIGVPIVRDYPVYDFKAKLALNLRF